jgi:hypothetical protein
MSNSPCPYNSTCSTAFAPTIQDKERSSSDYTSYLGAKTLYGYTNNTSNTYTQISLAPRFTSHADYMRYKRISSQMYGSITR